MEKEELCAHFGFLSWSGLKQNLMNSHGHGRCSSIYDSKKAQETRILEATTSSTQPNNHWTNNYENSESVIEVEYARTPARSLSNWSGSPLGRFKNETW